MLSLNVYAVSVSCSPSVNSDDAGGEQEYKKMKDAFNAIYEGALSERKVILYQQHSTIQLNQTCYCTEAIDPQRMNEDVRSWLCCSCFKYQKGRAHFRCFSDLCLFKRISGWPYHICSLCFNMEMDESVGDQDDEKGDGFICSKFRSHMNVIS